MTRKQTHIQAHNLTSCSTFKIQAKHLIGGPHKSQSLSQHLVVASDSATLFYFVDFFLKVRYLSSSKDPGAHLWTRSFPSRPLFENIGPGFKSAGPCI